MASLLATSGQNLVNNNRYDVMKSSIKVNTDIENLIKAEVFRKQIRIKEFFFDYDRLRKGTVTEDKFRSALSMLHMHITEKDILELITRYKVGVDLIDYVTFCKKVDEQFFDYNIAKSNLATTKSSSSLSEDEQSVIKFILSQIKQQISQKRIMLKQPFQDFDRTRCSHITVDQFSRVLQNLGLLPPEQYFNLLIRNYIDNGNPKEVNYVLFCDDVDNVSQMLETVIQGIKPNQKIVDPNQDVIQDPNKVALSSTLFKRLSHKPQGLIQVEEKIQAEVVMKRIRVREFFKDFDGLRKGTVSESQFRRVLHLTNINLSEDEIKILLEAYQVEKRFNGNVKYSDFCEAIDKVFTTKGIDKDPLYQVNQITSETTIPARKTIIGMTNEEQEKLNQLLDLYRKEIANKRVLIKPHFEDFDITKAGHISKGQFLRIINQFGLFPEQQALNLILKRYMDKGTLDEVNYYEFCRDVDIFGEGAQISKQYAESFKTFVKGDNENKTFIYNDTPNDLNDLLAQIRRRVSEFRIRVPEFLRDFDKLRTGTITHQQLRLGLNMAQIPLSDQEFNLILDYFKCPQQEGYVFWRNFCDAIDEVFSVKNLEQTSGTTLPVPVNVNFMYGKKPLTEQEINLAEELKKRFSFFCKATRLDIKQFFQDWDRQARNKVTPKQFRQVFATINFPMNEEQFQALVRMYYCEEEKDVRYVDFIRDTNVYEAMPVPSNQTKNEGINTALAGTRRSYDIDVLLDDIKNFIKINRLRVGEYFKDFDPLRKGIIPENKFAGVISQMKIDLDDKQIELLRKRYLLPNDSSKVNYDKFLSQVNVVFTIGDLEKDPLIQPPVFEKGTFIDPRDVLSNQEEQDLHVLLLRLGEVVRKHRLLFQTHFQDKDIAKSGKVSFTRFRSILDLHKIPLNQEQFRLLCKRFAHQGVEFNYVEFDEVLQNYEHMQ